MLLKAVVTVQKDVIIAAVYNFALLVLQTTTLLAITAVE